MKKALAITAAAALSATAAIPAFAATKTVSVKDNVFSPKSITVKKNDTVKWSFVGKAPHNVVVTKGPATFRSPVKTKGTFSKKLTRAGTYNILCTIHAPSMKMTVKVR
jgi:plastocyanin